VAVCLLFVYKFITILRRHHHHHHHHHLAIIELGVLLTRSGASGTRVRGFKPGRSRRIFSGEKILSMPSFGREVSRLPHVADLRHVKEPCDYIEVGSQAKFSDHFSPDFFPR
jgi:hypothetical protein